MKGEETMPKGNPVTEELKREVYALWEQGFNTFEIGERVGLSHYTVVRIARSNPTDEGLKSCPCCGIKSKKDARYCWWCGNDIRSEADKLLERVVSMRAMIHHLPENMRREFDDVTRDVIKYLEGEAHGQHSVIGFLRAAEDSELLEDETCRTK